VNVLIVLGVLCVVAAGAMWFLLALNEIDNGPRVVNVYVEAVHVHQPASVGDQLEAEFRALDKRS
jgi:acyl dehydratase